MDYQKKVNFVDLWPQIVRSLRNQCQEWLEELVA